MAVLNGTNANETFDTTGGGDFTTTSGDDIIRPKGGVDTVDAGDGNDVVEGQKNELLQDTLDGGDGTDEIVNENANQALQLSGFGGGGAG
ncbi:hypothetical protein AVJ23_00005, partial [Pseudoponticoccus marisrubri]